MVMGTVRAVNDDGTIAVECSNNIFYPKVRLLGYTYNNGESGISYKISAGMAVVVFIEGSLLFAIPVSGVGKIKEKLGDIGFYDRSTDTKMVLHYGKGLQFRAGNYVHMLMNAVNKGLYALAMRIGIGTDHYKCEIEDKEKHYGKIVIRDSNQKVIGNLAFGDDGEQDDGAVLNLQIDKNGKFIAKQKQKGELSYDTDGTVKLDTIKELSVSTDQSSVDVTSDKIDLSAGNEITIDGKSKVTLKVGSDTIVADTTKVTVNGTTAVEISAGGGKIKIGPAFVTMNNGSQFVALAIPLLTLLVSHTHVDPLSGTTGTAIIMGDPSQVVSKGVQAN